MSTIPVSLTEEQFNDHINPYLSKAKRGYVCSIPQVLDETRIEVYVTNEKEVYLEGEEPQQRVCRLASTKAHNALSHSDESSQSIQFIIGADTEIVFNNQVIENPANDEEKMRAILKMLSGNTHRAITGLTVLDVRDKQQIEEISDCVTTEIKFKTMTDDEIEDYIRSGEPAGKAGAYGIQGKGALFIEKINGSYSNVVGLPLEKLVDILNQRIQSPIWTNNKVSDWSLDKF